MNKEFNYIEFWIIIFVIALTVFLCGCQLHPPSAAVKAAPMPRASFAMAMSSLPRAATNRIARTPRVTLTWSPSSDTNVIGYKIYYGAASRTYTNLVNVANTNTATISGLMSGATYYFAATAYGISGVESDYSNECSYTVPLPKTNIVVTVVGQSTLWISGSVVGPRTNSGKSTWTATNPPAAAMFFRCDGVTSITSTNFW
jgi:hypothetical protein